MKRLKRFVQTSKSTKFLIGIFIFSLILGIYIDWSLVREETRYTVETQWRVSEGAKAPDGTDYLVSDEFAPGAISKFIVEVALRLSYPLRVFGDMFEGVIPSIEDSKQEVWDKISLYLPSFLMLGILMVVFLCFYASVEYFKKKGVEDPEFSLGDTGGGPPTKEDLIGYATVFIPFIAVLFMLVDRPLFLYQFLFLCIILVGVYIYRYITEKIQELEKKESKGSHRKRIKWVKRIAVILLLVFFPLEVLLFFWILFSLPLYIWGFTFFIQTFVVSVVLLVLIIRDHKRFCEQRRKLEAISKRVVIKRKVVNQS